MWYRLCKNILLLVNVFLEPEGTLPCLQEPATGLYFEDMNSVHTLTHCFLKIRPDITLLFTFKSAKCSLPFRFSPNNILTDIILMVGLLSLPQPITKKQRCSKLNLNSWWAEHGLTRGSFILQVLFLRVTGEHLTLSIRRRYFFYSLYTACSVSVILALGTYQQYIPLWRMPSFYVLMLQLNLCSTFRSVTYNALKIASATLTRRFKVNKPITYKTLSFYGNWTR